VFSGPEEVFNRAKDLPAVKTSAKTSSPEPDDKIDPASSRCAGCGGPILEISENSASLSIAHIDCDAFYASVEKRDNPALEHQPVIVGGGQRGVVTTACYLARTYGVRSAMPMFKALDACPNAVVVRPDFDKYRDASRAIRKIFEAATPLIEPLSIDEAFLDLSGTERINGGPAFKTLMGIQRRVETEVGVTVSVGLSGNKFLAKLASDLDKPNGFTVIHPDDAPERLAPLPVTKIWGIGAVSEKKLAKIGIKTIGDLQSRDVRQLSEIFSSDGTRLHDLAFGRDARRVSTSRDAKSLSAETTFREDTGDFSILRTRLAELCDDVSARMKAKQLVGRVVVVKLKSSDFTTKTKRKTLAQASNLADDLFEHGEQLLRSLVRQGTRYRLVGIGFAELHQATQSVQRDLFDIVGDEASSHQKSRERKEAAVEQIRAKFGDGAIALGRTGVNIQNNAKTRQQRRESAQAERRRGDDH
ncbi:MAG: DNA polymerase IV, partial [Pseudomonadota bacterium]